MDKLPTFCTLGNVGEGFEKVSVSYAPAWRSGRQDRIHDTSSAAARCTRATQPEHQRDHRIRQRHIAAATPWTHRTCGKYGRCQQGTRKDRRRVRRRVDSLNLFDPHSTPRQIWWFRGFEAPFPLILSYSTHLSVSSVFVASVISSCHDTPSLKSLCFGAPLFSHEMSSIADSLLLVIHFNPNLFHRTSIFSSCRPRKQSTARRVEREERIFFVLFHSLH